MLKISQIREGSILKREGKLVTVNGWMKYSNGTEKVVSVFTNEFEKGCYLSKYEPVSLTTAILEEFGFTNNRININDSDECIEIRLQNGTAHIWPSDGCTEGHNVSVDCKFLHQLQNLYLDIAGKELQRKLNA